MISASLSHAPETPGILGDSGVPFGCVVQPLAPLSGHQNGDNPAPPKAQRIARCGNCGAYINSWCDIYQQDWRCVLCSNVTPLCKRYKTHQLSELIELQEPIVEIDFPDDDESTPELSNVPICIAVVDVTAGSDYLHVIRLALRAAVSALPPESLFGLISVADTIGVYMLGSPSPHVRRIVVPDVGEPSVSIRDAVGLERMLIRPNNHAEHISAAIDTLGSSTASSNLAGQAHAARNSPRSGLGTALQLVVDALGTSSLQIGRAHV